MISEQFRDLIAFGVRMEAARVVKTSITLTIDGGLSSTLPISPWFPVWRTAIEALVAVVGGAGGRLVIAEVSALRALLFEGPDHPFIVDLASIGGSLANTFGILESVPFWEPQVVIHRGSKEIRRLADLKINDVGEAELEEALRRAAHQFLTVLREIGQEGRTLAEEVEAGNVLDLWSPMEGAALAPLGAVHVGGNVPVRIEGPDPATCRALRVLVLAVWRDRFGGADLVRRREKVIATSIPQELAHQSVFPLQRVDRVETRGGGVVVMVADRSEYLLRTAAAPPAVLDVLRFMAQVGKWYPVVADRLIRHLLRRCTEMYLSGGNPDSLIARSLTYDGGWSKLTEEAGINSSHRAEVPRVVTLLRAWNGIDGSQPALILDSYLSGQRGGKSVLTVVVGDLLFPDSKYLHNLPRGKGNLLPVLERPETRIPGVSGEKTSNIVLYHWLLVDTIRAGAIRMVETSEGPAVLLSKSARRAAAISAGLSPSEGEAVDRVWIGDGAGSWLTETGLRTRDGAVRLRDDDAMRLLIDACKGAKERGKSAARQRKRRG
jgi:hypothetical protein